MEEMIKRKWVFVKQPLDFEIDDCDCGNHNVTWSEYQGYLWCFNCEKEYVPKHFGVLDGPIPLHSTDLLVSLDIINLETNEILKCKTPEWDELMFGDYYNKQKIDNKKRSIFGNTLAGIHLSQFIHEHDVRLAGSIYTEGCTIFRGIYKSKMLHKSYVYNLVYKDLINRLDIGVFEDPKTRTYMKNIVKSIFIKYLKKEKSK